MATIALKNIRAMLGPIPFIEIFGREPITPLVRYWNDNRYSRIEFYFDMKIRGWTSKGGRFFYLEIDERNPWWKNLWRISRVGWIDPFLWKIRKAFV